MKQTQDYKEFWETCDPTYSHIVINKWLKDEENLFESWKELFIKELDWKGKVVVDYGCGGGYLGKLLLRDYAIKKYIGIDISKRSLGAACETTIEYNKKCEFSNDIYKLPKCDIVVCQAVIQHLENKTQVLDTLKLLQTQTEYIVLQTKTTSTGIGVEITESDIGNRIRITVKQLAHILNRFGLISDSGLFGKNNSQYTIWRRHEGNNETSD